MTLIEQYRAMTDELLLQTYAAVMANAYPGDETLLEDEIHRRGLSDVEYFY